MKKSLLLLAVSIMVLTFLFSSLIYAATPSKVTGLNATVYYSGRVDLSWSKATNAVSYFIEMDYQTGAGSTWYYYYAWTSTTTSLSVYPTMKDVNYRFRVRGVGSNWENGPFSDYKQFYMPK